MPKRQTILTQLAADLNNNFTVANGYTKIYETRVGVYNPDEFPSLPSIGVWINEDRAEEDLMDNSVFRRLEMVLYGHVDSDMMETYVTFYTLISDLEQFLYSTDSSYYKNTILGDVSIDYGGATEQTAMFVINFSILYSQAGLES